MRILLYILMAAATALSTRDVIAMHELEDRAERGDGMALSMLRDSAAAGSARAANFLGFLYWQGRGVRQDRDSGLYFLQCAADAGDMKAVANLGYIYIKGEGIGADTLKGLAYLNRAARSGVSSALRELDDLISGAGNGSGILAERYKTQSSLSLTIVAFNISAASRLPYDYERAMGYFLKAARSGDPSAQFIVAEHLEMFPDAFELNPEEETAGYWYDKARSGGVRDAVTARSRLDSRVRQR